MAKALYEEIIDEIGTQTLARFGLNIFNLNSYQAYGESVKLSNIATKSYKQHKNNPKSFGFHFENLDAGQKNIFSSMLKSGEKTYNTDTLCDIKKAYEFKQSGKNLANLNEKDRANLEFTFANFSDEIKNFPKNKEMQDFAIKNHPTTDIVTFDKNGNVIKRSQHKVIKDTKGLLEERYLNNNDVFTVPFDDYVKHKSELEKMKNDATLSSQKRQDAGKALEMLEKNNITNRIMCENPRTSAIIMQAGSGASHIAQAGLSDAIIVALSTLANGIVYEVKDACNSNSDEKIESRIKRLIKTVSDEFKNTFSRGASFGALDIAIETLAQIFKTIFAQLRYLWRNLRNAAKSIFNAIYSYIKGEIKSFGQLISVVIKALVGAAMVINTVALEAKLHLALSPIFTPIIASFLSPALAISIGALATVFISKQLDLTLNTFFTIFAERDLSRERYESIVKICDEYIPLLQEQTKELKELIHTTYKEREKIMKESFLEFTAGVNKNESQLITNSLIKINALYGQELRFKSQKEFDDFMESDEVFKL